MSTVACGCKRSCFFEENELPSPLRTKKLRCSGYSSSSSPALFSLPHLKSLFPQTDPQALEFGPKLMIESVLRECGNDLDLAVNSLQAQCVGTAEEADLVVEQERLTTGYKAAEALANDGDAALLASENATAASNLPADGAEWVDLFVSEMMSATSVDDARSRASKVLEVLEISISTRAAKESAWSFGKENIMLKEKIEVLMRENTKLKRAVAVQHERQKDHENKSRELQQLMQLVSQYQEQLRTTEVNNYALAIHLRQASQSHTDLEQFHPDIF